MHGVKLFTKTPVSYFWMFYFKTKTVVRQCTVTTSICGDDYKPSQTVIAYVTLDLFRWSSKLRATFNIFNDNNFKTLLVMM